MLRIMKYFVRKIAVTRMFMHHRCAPTVFWEPHMECSLNNSKGHSALDFLVPFVPTVILVWVRFLMESRWNARRPIMGVSHGATEVIFLYRGLALTKFNGLAWSSCAGRTMIVLPGDQNVHDAWKLIDRILCVSILEVIEWSTGWLVTRKLWLLASSICGCFS